MARGIVKILSIIFASAVAVSLILHPQALTLAGNATTSVVKGVTQQR